jgi:hypothetical protein
MPGASPSIGGSLNSTISKCASGRSVVGAEDVQLIFPGTKIAPQLVEGLEEDLKDSRTNGGAPLYCGGVREQYVENTTS